MYLNSLSGVVCTNVELQGVKPITNQSRVSILAILLILIILPHFGISIYCCRTAAKWTREEAIVMFLKKILMMMCVFLECGNQSEDLSSC